MYDLILRGGTVVDGTRSRPYDADVCIRDGRIAEEGSHRALLALDGEYARLYHTQNVGETYGQA